MDLPNDQSTDSSKDPSAIPFSISSMTVTFTLLLLIDLAALFPLVGYCYLQTAIGVLLPGGIPQPLRFNYQMLPYGIGSIVCLATIFGLLLFAFPFLSGRMTLGVAGYRLMAWGIVILHPLLALFILAKVFVLHPAIQWRNDIAMVAVVPATPFLYLLIKPLMKMRWLDLNAEPEEWEPMAGIDPRPSPTFRERGGRESGFMITAFLTPLACWRAKMYVRMMISALLYLATIILVLNNPLRAFVGIAANAVIVRSVLSAFAASPDRLPALTPSARSARLREIFTPDRLAPPPKFLAIGIIAYLILMPLDLEMAWFANSIGHAPNLHALTELSQTWPILLPFISMALAVPVGLVLPLGLTWAIAWFRATGCLLVILHILLLMYALRVFNGPFGQPPTGATPLLQPVAWLLAMLTPFVASILFSLPGAGTVRRTWNTATRNR